MNYKKWEGEELYNIMMVDAMEKIIEDPSYYDMLSQVIIYVKNLEVQGWNLLNKIGKNGDDHKLYWVRGRVNNKLKWVRFFAVGTWGRPHLKYIKWYNGVILCDYSRFDSSRGVDLTEDVMRQNMQILTSTFGFEPIMPSKAIEELAKRCLNPVIVKYEMGDGWNELENSEWLDFVNGALIGGSSVIQPRFLKKRISRETHIDYHQIYGSVLKNPNCIFPKLFSMQVCEGFCKAEGSCAIYIFGPNSYATVKPYGYALWGEKVDLSTQPLCNVDFETLSENYDVHAGCSFTLKWNRVWHGGDDFIGPLVDLIYNARMKYKGTPAEGVFKVYNEILPGVFSRDTYLGSSVWRAKTLAPAMLKEENEVKTVYNPKIGVFINAYARAMLNNLLHRIPYDKVIGWDTDAVFFKGTPAEVPTAVKVLYGELPGQLHLDGNYSNVYHSAPKSYWGWDEDNRCQFSKRVGVPKSGKIAMWNPETTRFDIKDYSSDTIVRK